MMWKISCLPAATGWMVGFTTVAAVKLAISVI